jgi:PAS domain S-box-containing protein
MLTGVVLATSISLQLIAVLLALRLIRVTGWRMAWTVIALALVLMSVRRVITLSHIISGSTTVQPDLAAELVALAISGLMVAGMACIGPLVTAARRDATALRESEASYRDILDGMTDTFYRTDAAGWLEIVSPSVKELLGYEPDELVGRRLADLYVHPQGRREFLKRLEESGGRVSDYRAALRHKDGGTVWVSTSAHFRTDEDGTLFGTEGTVRDITERQRTEEALKKSEAIGGKARRQLEDAIESISDGFALWDAGNRLIAFNNKLVEFSPEIPELIRPGARFDDLVRAVADRGGADYADMPADAWIGDRIEQHQRPRGPWERKLDDGRWLRVTDRNTRDGGTVTVWTDITELKTRERELESSEAYFRSMIENASDIITVLEADGTIRFESPSVERLLGYEPEELVGERVFDLVHPEDLSEVADTFGRGLQNPGTTESVTFRFRRKDGSWRTLEAVGKNLLQDPSVAGIVVNSRDVTERIEAGERLRQAQKMEVLGQLTGGVAHDFNNLLGIIMGNLELMKEDAEFGGETSKLIEQALSATECGANLTQQLLAYSRKQTLQPRPMNVGRMVADLIILLRRTLGENRQITLTGEENLWLCDVDPAQMENALLNMAINARDAMPQGGKLTFTTANVRFDGENATGHEKIAPGQYVRVSIADDGVGMSKEVQAHVFEPFFTTKGMGKGTGLGLAMAYGFARQSGGQITFESEIGKGTTFHISLPRSQQAEDPIDRDTRSESPLTQDERILVVEDDGDLRSLVVAMLGGLGYEVQQAGDGQAALGLLKADTPIDLLFTDVVLPGGIGGYQLAEQARALRPSLKVLYMSGYSEDSVAEPSTLNADRLVQKPFRRAEIARAIRKTLEA